MSIRIWKRIKLSLIFCILPFINFLFLNRKMYSISKYLFSPQYQTFLLSTRTLKIIFWAQISFSRFQRDQQVRLTLKQTQNPDTHNHLDPYLPSVLKYFQRCEPQRISWLLNKAEHDIYSALFRNGAVNAHCKGYSRNLMGDRQFKIFQAHQGY